MPTRAALIAEINGNIIQNSTQSVTGLKLNQVLIDMVNSFLIPDTDFPLSPSKGGTGTANSDSRTITLGGTISTGGNLSTSSTMSVTGAFTTNGAFVTANTFRTTGNFSMELVTTAATVATFPAGTDTLAGFAANNTFTGNNAFNTGTFTVSGNATFQTGTLTIANGATISSGNLGITSGNLTVSTGVTSLRNTTMNGTLTFADAINIAFNTGTGTQIGTAAAQKIGFWGGTPKSRQNNTIVAATFAANTSGILDDSGTWNGYSIGQIVAILQTYGMIA